MSNSIPSPFKVANDLKRLDQSFVTRLLLGALAESEQRWLAASLMRRDPRVRQRVAAYLEPLELFDLDLVERYANALTQNREVQELRTQLQAEAAARRPELASEAQALTYRDVFALGPGTRAIFTWSAVETLLAKVNAASVDTSEIQTSLYLASMATDVLELLAIARDLPALASVVADLRSRIATAELEHGD